MQPPFERGIVQAVLDGCARTPDLLQVVTGPRQVGKTTAAHQVAARWEGPVRYQAADQFLPPGPEWIHAAWELARRDAARVGKPVLLVLDEVQKARDWSEAVKAEWDEDRRMGAPVRGVLLGSSALLLARGTTESLAGRFRLHRCPHWSYPECRDAFGWDLDIWLWKGGYPGVAQFGDDDEGRRAYVRDALVEAVLARDVLSLEPVNKPALLRQLFGLTCRYPAQILACNKMLGQLHDAGNTTTLAHYLDLLGRAFLVSGLAPYATSVRQRAGSPKLVLWNSALITAFDPRGFEAYRADAAGWGRLVENAVGAHLLNHLQGRGVQVGWWRDGDAEVDFVVAGAGAPLALEVKSGRPRSLSGLRAFTQRYPQARPLIVGQGGMPLEEFFSMEAGEILR
jgi:predicted AAA+ superfamily ATPase